MHSNSPSIDTTQSTPQVAASPEAQLEHCVLDVFDMHCAGCAVLIENALATAVGVSRARVHYATQRARVSFAPNRTNVEKLLSHIAKLGYVADAGAHLHRPAIARRQRHRHILGVGLSALCAMQIMMLTLPRFLAGAEMEPELAPLLDWTALALLLPVIFWTAQPFYRGAQREFRLRRPGMDSAVTLGIASASSGSMWHLLAGTGALYFDSVAMFVALLLAVRWLEWEQRERSQAIIHAASRSQAPVDVMRIDGDRADGKASLTPIQNLAPGDKLWIRTGEAVPVDGLVESEFADLDESMLTGESASVRRFMGRAVNAGAINAGAVFMMRASCGVEASTERRLMNLADDSNKPDSLVMANRIAHYFMPAVILVAGATFLAMLPAGLTVAAERAIAVLIITCPCALALAAPAAHAQAFAGLLRRGVVLRRADALARLAKADTFLLDKTATLSMPQVCGLVFLRDGLNERKALAIIATLERAANHPLAIALRSLDFSEDPLVAMDLHWAPGEGVSGSIDGVRYRFGRAAFVGVPTDESTQDGMANRLWLSDETGILGALDVAEVPRTDALSLVRSLRARGSVEILSGDHAQKTLMLAKLLNIRLASGERTAEQKALRVRELQLQGRTVVMIGDGVNDSIGFARADVAIAVTAATDAARASADLVCINPNLAAVDDAIEYSHTVSTVIRENFVWAVMYNLIAIPFAIAGVVTPLTASVGMAASSAVVMLNVLRLARTPEISS